MLLATFLGLTGTAAAAEFESGIVFQGRQLIVLESGKAAQSRAVVLCDASDHTVTGIHWDVGGFHFTDGEKAVGDNTVVSLSPTQPQLAPGDCESVTVTVAAEPEIDPGPFVGELVVTSAGSGVARLEVSVAGPASPIVPTKGAAETIELTATRKLPFGSGSVSIDGDSALALKAPPSGKSLEVPKKGAFIGNLVNAGDIASVYVTGEPVKHEEEGVWLLPIEVRGAANTGVYEGVLTPTSSNSETQTVKAKVTVTVWWVWAVVAVLLGTGLVVGPTVWIRRYRVKGKLDDRRQSLVNSYAAAGKVFHQQFPKFAGIEAPEEADVNKYSAAVETAINAYAESTWYFDTTSDAYAKLVKSLDTAEADVECLAGEGEEESLGKVLTDLEGTLEGLAAQLRKYLPIERQPAIALAAGAFLHPGRRGGGGGGADDPHAESQKVPRRDRDLDRTRPDAEALRSLVPCPRRDSCPQRGPQFLGRRFCRCPGDLRDDRRGQERASGSSRCQGDRPTQGSQAPRSRVPPARVPRSQVQTVGRLAATGPRFRGELASAEAGDGGRAHGYPRSRTGGDRRHPRSAPVEHRRLRQLAR